MVLILVPDCNFLPVLWKRWFQMIISEKHFFFDHFFIFLKTNKKNHIFFNLKFGTLFLKFEYNMHAWKLNWAQSVGQMDNWQFVSKHQITTHETKKNTEHYFINEIKLKYWEKWVLRWPVSFLSKKSWVNSFQNYQLKFDSLKNVQANRFVNFQYKKKLQPKSHGVWTLDYINHTKRSKYCWQKMRAV